jgi:cbb3-type cytochrome oxidase cytochrome c subunit
MLSFASCIRVSLALVVLVLTDHVDADEVAPGLIAKYTDGASTVTTIAITPNFALSSGETIHPQIEPEFSATWTGFLRIVRGDKYAISANTGAVVKVNGQPTSDGPIALPTGDHALEISYTRKPGDARLQLRWDAEHFYEEPIPSSAFGHSVANNNVLLVQQKIDDGLLLFAELGCGACHQSDGWKLNSRRGPDLSNVGHRATPDWIRTWLESPQHYRQSAIMPRLLADTQAQQDVAAFLSGLTDDAYSDSSVRSEDRIAAGKELFEQTGCLKCHTKQNSLDDVGNKFKSVEALKRYIADPHKTDPHGRMPQLFDPKTGQHHVQQIAEYLFFEHRKKSDPKKPIGPGNADRGQALAIRSGCVNCHVIRANGKTLSTTVKAPAFGPSVGLPLKHLWTLNGNTTDAAANNNGSVHGATKFQAIQDRKGSSEGQAFAFDGKNYIKLPHFPRPDVMTITAWVKTSSGGSILTWGRPGGGRRGSRELRMNIGQDGKNSVCYGEYNSDGGWKPVAKKSKVNIVDNNWHSIAVVRKSQDIELFVDGESIGTGKTQPAGSDYTDTMMIGANALSGNPNNRFKGLISDVSVWQIPLSRQQIASIAAGRSPLKMARPPQEDVAAFSVNKGCLAESVGPGVPNYQLTNEKRAALQAFLKSKSQDSKIRQAPLSTYALRIRQFNCTACHEMDHLNKQSVTQVTEKGRVIQVQRPPRLTGLGDKLTVNWLQQVLVNRKRTRPWLKMKMPHFGNGISDLPSLAPKSAGVEQRDSYPQPSIELANAGLKTIGVQRGQVACIACHNYRDINRRKGGVVPAPDLADVGQTVRHDWYKRWLNNPTRLQPGTSMPQFFLQLSAAQKAKKVDELWAAHVHQKRLPLPDGLLRTQTEGTRIVVKDSPVIFRMATKTAAGQINRAINVGLPGGLNYTFDPEGCQLRFAWKGDFIDAGPAWNGRGGNPVNASGTVLFKLPDQFPLRIGSFEKPQLRFRGYRLENKNPVFRYELNGKLVEHRISLDAQGISQSFTIQKPENRVRFLSAADYEFKSDDGEWSEKILTLEPADEVKFTVRVAFP